MQLRDVPRPVRVRGGGVNALRGAENTEPGHIWVVVKIMAPFWVPIIIRHLLFRVPKKGP